jgi:hypothetical protein
MADLFVLNRSALVGPALPGRLFIRSEQRFIMKDNVRKS